MRIIFRLISINSLATLLIFRYFFFAFYLRVLRFFSEDKQKYKDKSEKLLAKCLTTFFRNLGATFIKLGQVMSARPDVFPPYIIEELETLQDKVPAFPYKDVEKIIKQELGGHPNDFFIDFDQTPIAAASISQVHEAKLSNGKRVVLKIQRPDIETKMKQDLKLIIFLANIIHKIPGLNNLGINQWAEQFSDSLLLQLDFSQEIANNRRFAKNLEKTPYLSVPEIYPDYCSDRIICMEFADGKKFTEIVDNPPLDPNLMAERLFSIFLDMGFRDFFIHADLHPGNILVDKKGNYILIDTGLVYEVPNHFIRKFFRVVFSGLTYDGHLIGEAYLEGIEMSEEKKQAAMDDLDVISKKYIGLDLNDIEISASLMEAIGLLRKHKIYLDAEWSGLLLAIITFEGLAKMISEDFDVVGFFMKKFPEYIGDDTLMEPDDPIVIAILSTLAKDQIKNLLGNAQKRWMKPGIELYLAWVNREEIDTRPLALLKQARRLTRRRRKQRLLGKD